MRVTFGVQDNVDIALPAREKEVKPPLDSITFQKCGRVGRTSSPAPRPHPLTLIKRPERAAPNMRDQKELARRVRATKSAARHEAAPTVHCRHCRRNTQGVRRQFGVQRCGAERRRCATATAGHARHRGREAPAHARAPSLVLSLSQTAVL